VTRPIIAAVDDLTTTTGIVAAAAAVLAIAALVTCVVLVRRLSRLRADQRVLLADHEDRDLVAHAAEMERGFRALSSYVEDVALGLHGRLEAAEAHMQGAVAYRGLVRYDAYNEMSGRQSTSIALLDSRGSGVVLSSIHHRDQARLYAKQVIDGNGLLQLSPEEEEAVRIALAGDVPDPAEHP
jgi:hypothetical protein